MSNVIIQLICPDQKGIIAQLTSILYNAENNILSIEQHVDWISDFIEYSLDQGITEIEATSDAEIEWTNHVEELAENSLKSNSGCNSWYLGSNVPGKKRVFMPYLG